MGLSLALLAPLAYAGLFAWGGYSHPASGPGTLEMSVDVGTSRQLCDQSPVCGGSLVEPFFSLPYYDPSTGTTVALIGHPGVEVWSGVLGRLVSEAALPSNCLAEAIFPGPGNLVEIPCSGASNSSLLVLDAASGNLLGTLDLPGYLIGAHFAAWDGGSGHLYVSATRQSNPDVDAPSFLLSLDVGSRALLAAWPLPGSYALDAPLAFDPATGQVLYGDFLNSSIREVDPATGDWTTFAAAVGNVNRLTVDPAGGRVYASQLGAYSTPDSLAALDLRTGAFLGDLAVSASWGGQVDPATGTVYFFDGYTFTAVNGTTGEIVGRAAVPSPYQGHDGGGWTVVPGEAAAVLGQLATWNNASLVSLAFHSTRVAGTAFSAVPGVGSNLPAAVGGLVAAVGVAVTLTLGLRELMVLRRYRREEGRREWERLISE